MIDNSKLYTSLLTLLANSYALYIKTQNYHWNVTGPNFHSLHLLFEDQYKELADAIDMIAEQIRALNFHVPASFSAYAKYNTIKDGYDKADSQTMIKDLVEGQLTILSCLANVMEEAKQVENESVFDLAVERSRAHDKQTWMLKSSL
ncbi:Metalloregulation DNA-binding stress protein [Rickettsiales bacterium Ac37b]|nr:Metalloregulation DNA-binding stress protein [Rickettsiales bacterium Ac37b]